MGNELLIWLCVCCLPIWCMHVGIVAGLSWPLLVFGGKRACWQMWELLAFILPYSIWIIWTLVGHSGNGNSEVCELYIISFAVVVAVILRVTLGHRERQFVVSGVLLLLLGSVAVGTCLMAPLPQICMLLEPRGPSTLLLWMWFWHVGVAAVLSSPLLFFGCKRACWQMWELVAFVLPYSIWVIWLLTHRSDYFKGIGSLGGCFSISFAISLAVLLRVILGQHERQFMVSGVLLLLLCVLSVAAYYWTPQLLRL